MTPFFQCQLAPVHHGVHVTNARFSYNDEFLITTGGSDRCAFQWRHYEADEGDEEMTSEVGSDGYVLATS